MKNRYFLLSALAAAAVMPGTASANLVLDMPPILAGNSSSTCNECNACDPTCINPCTKCTGTCCAGQCHPASETGYCCNGTYGPDPCSSSATGKLNDTGITNNITSVAGDDAEYGRDADTNLTKTGSGHAGFDFTKSGNCVTDNVTGLTWSPDQTSTFAWSGIAAQVSSVNTAKLCGYSDWRAPAVKELVSIVSYHKTSPAIDDDTTRGFFTDTQSAIYWTATPNAADITKAWGVNFLKGNADNNITKTSSFRLRLVRP